LSGVGFHDATPQRTYGLSVQVAGRARLALARFMLPASTRREEKST
jgi:hypothetical protein